MATNSAPVTGATGASASAIAPPTTPPRTHGTQRDHDADPGAPRRPNHGRVNVNGNVVVWASCDHNAFAIGDVESPTAVRSGLQWIDEHTIPFEGSAPWAGPPAVSGQLARPDDPFITNRMARLSAAAPVFDPNPGNYPWNPPPGPPPGMGGPSSGTPPGGDSSSNGGNSTSNNSGNATGGRSSGRSSGNGQCSDDLNPVIVNGSTPNDKGKQPAIADCVLMAGATRFVRVPNVQTDDFHEHMLFGRVKDLHCFREDVQKNGIFAIKSDDQGNMTVFMFCDSKSNACTMYSRLKPGFRETAFLSQQEFEAVDVEIPEEIERFSSKVVLSISVKKASVPKMFSLNAITDMAKTAAAKFGKILSFQVRFHNGGYGWAPTVAKYDIEFDSVKDACDIILSTKITASGVSTTHAQAEHIQFHADALDFEILRNLPPRQGGTGFEFSGTGRTGTRVDAKGQRATTSGYSKLATVPGPAPKCLPEPTGFGAPPIYEAFDPINGGYMQTYDGQLHPNISRPQDVIDQRIEDGSDCRTTLMIRNFPPEFSGQNLIDLLNTVCPGKYDFAYNRIDFRQNQSVGYGFVNFISATWLLVFVKACRGKLLHHNIQRRHPKPCAVSYANVQGFECLVAKFRNSSILEEAEGCRPKLFWSDESAPSQCMVGEQRPWPHVDNDSKKARSMENAQTLGLYAPRRTNGGRGGRAARFSRYDRGTSAQQNDENLNNYNVAANATTMPFGHVPRYQPQMLFDPRSQQFVPAGMPFQAQYAGPQLPGSMLRSHTNGQLGYTQPVMPAHLAPVTFPSQGQTVSQDDFSPLLYPLKGQVQKYYIHK